MYSKFIISAFVYLIKYFSGVLKINTLIGNKFAKSLYLTMSLTHQHITMPFMDSLKGELSTLQINALSALVTQGPMNMTELEKKIFIAKQQLTQVVAKLIEMGYVQREFSRYDQRVVMLTHTVRRGIY